MCAGWLSIALCTGFMAVWGITFFALRHVIGALFVRDATVARVAHLHSDACMLNPKP